MAKLLPPNIYDEVIEFLASGPTLEQIVAFRASDVAKKQLKMLLDRKQRSRLSKDDKAELDEMSTADFFFSLVRAHAIKRLQARKVTAQE